MAIDAYLLSRKIYKRLASLAEQVEVVQLQSEATTVDFEANKLKSSKVEETSGVAVRVIRYGQLGFSASSDLDALDRLVANVLESAAYGEPATLRFPGYQPAPAVTAVDQKISNISVQDMVEMGRGILEIILGADPTVQVNISLQRSSQRVSVQSDPDGMAAFKRTPFSITVDVARIEGDDVLILYDMLGATAWPENYLDLAHKTAARLRTANKLTTIQPGKMPVLFAPSGSLVLAFPLTQGLNGKNVFNGVSPIGKKAGEKLFDARLNIIDDATLDGRYQSAPYDDEGVPHQRNTLVENGVLKGFIYDLLTAAQSGMETTGNGSRSLFRPPAPSFTNLLIEAGDTPVADMARDIEYGLLVEDVLGMGQGNIISGAFSNPVNLAYKIEKGEIVGRVKNVSIAGNVYELLKDVSAISQERQWIFNNFYAPSILIPEMNVVAKE